MLHLNRGDRLWLVTLLIVSVMTLRPSAAAALDIGDFTFSHLGPAEGLNSQRIYSIKQTDDGAVWMTTQRFVARYNGAVIEIFELGANGARLNPAERNLRFVQSSDSVPQVFDSWGNIYRYNPVQNRFDIVADVSTMFRIGNKLTDVYMEGDTYWLATGKGVYTLRDGNATQLASGMYVNCIIPGPGGVLLFGTRQGLKSLSRKEGAPSGRKLKAYLPHVVVSGHYDTDTRRLWLGTYDKGLIIADGNGVTDTVKGVPHNPVRNIVAYDSKTMLAGVDGFGVYRVTRLPSARHTASLLFDANDGEQGVLHGNGIYALLVDTWRDIFIGSYSGGIDIARPVGSTVTTFMHQRNDPQSLLNNHVNCVAQLSDTVVAMGTDNGISVLNPLTGKWHHIARGLVVLALCPDSDGDGLLAATYGDGVCEINARGEVRKRYDVDTLGENHVHDLLTDRNGHLWIACQDAHLVEVADGKIRRYPVENIKSLALLPDGRIAAGTIQGLYLVTPGHKEVEELPYFSSDSSQVNRFILDLFIHDERYLDIATDGGGLYVYDLRTGDCRQLTMNEGLPSNTVTGVTQDELGRLWFATDRGLSFADPDILDKIISVNYHYGLQREYSTGAATSLENGNLLFGSEAGAVMVNPHHVQQHNYTVNLRFKGIGCNDGDTEKFNEQAARMLGEGRLDLTYGQRTFELYFESINLRYQFDIAYQYKVGDGSWSPLTDQQYIRFVNLEPGTHHLTVRAVSNANHFVLGERELVITVGRPWWNSWWMWCVYMAIVILLFYGVWWTYGLHSRYMRLVVSALKHGEGDIRTASEHHPDQQEAAPEIPAADGQTVHMPDSREAAETSVEPEETEGTADTRQKSDFVDTVTRLLLNHISDTDFTIDSLCREMAMSRTMFYVKLKSYTGKSPQEFIRVVRLERAAVLLRSGHQVGRVAMEVGYDNAKYFSTAFKKYFGVPPSKFQ